jgi:tRNA (cmo5U34)-methyltransferase
MAYMGKQDNIFEGGNLSGLPFTFNQEVTEVFEDMIDRSVPGYKTSLSLIAHNAKKYYQSNTNCYDIGCSLGASSLSILKGAKDANVTAIDNSEAMIQECERRFSILKESHHLKFICEDIMDSDLKDASLIVVNYVIQFLDMEHRDILLEKIYKALLPGGILILSEKIHHKNMFETKRLFKTHHKFKSSNGYSDLEISGKRDALEGVLKTECEQDHILRAKKAGFSNSEKILSNLNFRTFKFLK